MSVALVIKHAKRMRHSTLSSVACLAPEYFSTSHKRNDFRKKKVIGHKTRVLTFSTTLPDKFLILRRIERYAVINVNISLGKAPTILVVF